MKLLILIYCLHSIIVMMNAQQNQSRGREQFNNSLSNNDVNLNTNLNTNNNINNNAGNSNNPSGGGGGGGSGGVGGGGTRSHSIYQRLDGNRNHRNASASLQYQPSSYYNNNNNNNNNVELDLLNRINDRMTSLITLQDQQLKRLEAFEYKFTKLEVTTQERSENLRAELKALTHQIDNIDDTIRRFELDQFKTEFDGMRQSLETQNIQCHQRLQQQVIGGGASKLSAASQSSLGSVQNSDNDEILDSISTTLTSARLALHRIENEIYSIGTNVTAIRSTTKDILQLERMQPTKQFLNNAVYSLKSQPIYALMQNGFQSSRNGLDLLNTPNSCSDVHASSESGVYSIQINSVKEPFYVYCDLETDSDKWTVILNRVDGSVNFFRNWLEYKNGFGNINGEFWIGLDKLHEITTSKLHELYIVLEDFEGVQKTAKYSTFAIAGEREDYSLNVLGAYSGDAGDSLSYHAGQKFSTFDTDNDGWAEGNCAQAHSGGWWYNSCDMSNLNGKYLNGELGDALRYQGVYWNDFKGSTYSLKIAKMMIRPLN